MSDKDKTFYRVVLEHKLYKRYRNERNLRNFLYAFFGDTPLAGKKVLDIGGGAGLLSFSAIHRGASKAVCLEPEAAGSSAGVRERFAAVQSALGYGDRVRLLPVTFQDFDPEAEKYDIAVSHQSINHLDEQACSTLLSNDQSRARYLEIFLKLKTMLNPGAVVIIYDCSRYNIFQFLGITNPIAKTIRWDLHQDPYLWQDLLVEAGFVQPAVRWASFNTLGSLGRLLLSNQLAAYFLRSTFYLTVQTP
jgi:2-polyprenyl-3-methyl-5-hydroxy-6-metoxy-1,4-benzoquinol methylase